VNGADIVVAAGASWVLRAGGTIAANETFVDSGTLTGNGTILTAATVGPGPC
jgi:hypothetical protein